MGDDMMMMYNAAELIRHGGLVRYCYKLFVRVAVFAINCYKLYQSVGSIFLMKITN